jgi:hypothetical protein
MKQTNKILSVVLAILMVISIIPITSSAAEPTSGICGDNLTWEFDEYTSTLTISGTGAMYDYESVSMSGFFINQPWYSFADKITKIVINDGVTYIGEYAFYKCENLTSITMSGSVTEIGCYAFAFCIGLTSLTIPYGVTTIDVGAFGALLYLTTVTIPCSVKTIANEAFILSYGIKDVYYSGCEAQWNEIFIGTSNFPDATIHFLGEEVHECSYNAVVTPPTCTEQGYTTYTCECGDSYVDDYVDATGHNYNAVVTAPTCTEQGYTTYTCECGDSYVDDYVHALGHTEETIPAVAPTCNETGLTEGSKCSVCGDTITEQEIVPETDHAEETIPAVAPTCTETGLTEGAKCSICGETLTEQKELPANGHSPANTVEENYVAPICTENGSKDVVTYCTVCDEEISRETETIEATGHADNDGDGCCDACNEQLEDNNDSQISIMSIIMMIINFILELFGIK